MASSTKNSDLNTNILRHVAHGNNSYLDSTVMTPEHRQDSRSRPNHHNTGGHKSVAFESEIMESTYS